MILSKYRCIYLQDAEDIYLNQAVIGDSYDTDCNPTALEQWLFDNNTNEEVNIVVFN